MKSRAAIAFEAGKPLEIAEVDVAGPATGEVMIEVKATGVCHTDAFSLSGEDPEGAFPAILAPRLALGASATMLASVSREIGVTKLDEYASGVTA